MSGRATIAIACAVAAAGAVGCLGDDTSVAPRAPGPTRDATVDPSDGAPRARKDAADLEAPAEAGPCVPAGRLVGDAASPEDGGSDATVDASSLDGAACLAQTIASVDFGAAPRVATGGPRPGAWQVGRASAAFGPALDRLGRPGECFLATRPGARYRLSEEAWAELAPVDLRGVPPGCPVTLGLWIWYELEVGLDAANVVVSAGGGPFEPIGRADDPSLYDSDDFVTSDCGGGDCQVFMQSVWSTFATGSTTWRRARFDLSRFAGLPDLRIRFQLHTDGFANYQGLYVQDVVLSVP